MQAPITVDVLTMRTSDGGADYFPRMTCEGRSVTPHKFRERWQAEYEADYLSWVLGLRAEEPDVLDYGPDSHPND